MHRLFHKKGNSISTTTPSYNAMPSSAQSTPMPCPVHPHCIPDAAPPPCPVHSHRRNHSATPDVLAGPRKLVKAPLGKFKPAPAPLPPTPIPDPALEREAARNDPAQPFFASLEDGYLDKVPSNMPVNIPPHDVAYAFGRHMRNETVPTRRPHRAAQPQPVAATVFGRHAQPTSISKRDTSKPPSSRPKMHRNHMSDSAAYLLTPSRPAPKPRADSPRPLDVNEKPRTMGEKPRTTGEKPRTIRVTGTLDAPKPKTYERSRPTQDNRHESVYTIGPEEEAFKPHGIDKDSKYRGQSQIVYYKPITEPDVFARQYWLHGVSTEWTWMLGEKAWASIRWEEEWDERDGKKFREGRFIPDCIRQVFETKKKAEEQAILDSKRVTRMPIGALIPEDFTPPPAGYKPSPYKVAKRPTAKPLPPTMPPPVAKPPIAKLPVAKPHTHTQSPPAAKPPPTTALPSVPYVNYSINRKPGMFKTGVPREQGVEVPDHIDHRYRWLPRYLKDMTPDELDVLYDILRDQIIDDCSRWMFYQGDPRRGGTARALFNRTLQNTIDHNAGIATRHAQRLALDKVMNAVEDLHYDNAPAPKGYETIYRELMKDVEDRKLGKRKEVERGNVARTAVTVAPGMILAGEVTRPLSHF
ncbi:hypothetical protein PENSPDRAFT_753773 [Peniophora sp. CONT]|nr:hypothetical protein PENSPDRAFT_753773 [Peniophora sp. CONT]